jgi:hypothetical protein
MATLDLHHHLYCQKTHRNRALLPLHPPLRPPPHDLLPPLPHLGHCFDIHRDLLHLDSAENHPSLRVRTTHLDQAQTNQDSLCRCLTWYCFLFGDCENFKKRRYATEICDRIRMSVKKFLKGLTMSDLLYKSNSRQDQR